jgi:ribosomal RNA assembly protein
MRTIFCDKIVRIIKNHKKLTEELKVKITNRGKEVTIDGIPENEIIAEQVIDALNFGFPYIEAISIKKENKILETINIKEHTKQANLQRVRGRVIGKGGKALSTLSNLTDSAIELKDNTVAIIAEPEQMKRTTEAIIAIIKGAKHGAVYKELEHNFPKQEFDLKLRDAPIKTMEEYEKTLEKNKDSE